MKRKQSTDVDSIMEDFAKWLDDNNERKRRKKGQREVEQCFTHLCDEVARVENLTHTELTRYMHDDLRTVLLSAVERLHEVCAGYGYYIDAQKELRAARERYNRKSQNARTTSLDRLKNKK